MKSIRILITNEYTKFFFLSWIALNDNWLPKAKIVAIKKKIVIIYCMLIASVEFSHSVMSDSLQPHGLQHARLPCLSPTPGACSNSCPLSQWCMPSNHLILCHLLLLPPSISPSIRVFSNESILHIRWPKYWSFTFSISPSNEYSGLIL